MSNFQNRTARNLLNWRWFVLFFVMSFLFWGARPLTDSTEARYGEATRELVASGQWYIPQLEGHPHLTKPAVTYWIIAAGMKILGTNAWGARLGHAFLLFATMVLVAHLARAMGLEDNEARAAALVYATSVYTVVAGHVLSTDLPLLCFVLLGLLAYWKVFRGDPAAERWRAVFWLAFAAAFLTKGPPGWLPLLPVVAHSYLCRDRRVGPRLFFHRSTIVYLPLFLLLSASWYLALVIRHPELARYFYQDEFIDRIATTKHKRTAPLWEYPGLLIGGPIPWIFCWPQLLVAARGKLRGGLASLLPWQAFCLLWIGLILPVFEISKSKMPLYINGLFVPLCLGFGVVLARKWMPRFTAAPPAKQRLLVGTLGVWALALCALSVAENPFAHPRHHRALAEKLVQLAPSLPSNARYFFLDEQALYSLSFYSGIVIPEARWPDKTHISEPDFVKFHSEQVAAGVFPVYVTQNSHVDRFMSRAGMKQPVKRLLSDHLLTIYCFDPPSGS